MMRILSKEGYMNKNIELIEEIISSCQFDTVTYDINDLAQKLELLKISLKEDEVNNVDWLDFKEIANHLYDAIYITDGTGKTLFVNKAYEEIMGISLEQIIGKSTDEIMKEGLYKGAVSLEVIEKKKRVNSIGQSLVNGAEILVTGNPIFDNNGEVCLVVTNNRDFNDLIDIKKQLHDTKELLKVYETQTEEAKREVEHLRQKQTEDTEFTGVSQKVSDIMTMVKHIASTDATVLITGETGVGKEVLANEIVRHSKRRNKPFIKINCSAIPEGLLEAELFGYAPNTFTGSDKKGRAGLFEVANKGTLLLDEIGDMKLSLQSKLLRVLQEGGVRRIGEAKTIAIDVRIIAATNSNITEKTQKGEFREDLYYRLNVIPIHIPCLRERKEDIGALVELYRKMYNRKYNKQIEFDEKTKIIFCEYSWFGNVREIKNVLERTIIISSDNESAKNMIREMLVGNKEINEFKFDAEMGLKASISNYEKKIFEQMLTKYKTSRAIAKHLKIDQSTVVKKLQKYNIKL